MNGWLDGQIDKWVNSCMHESKDGRTDIWTNNGMSEQTIGQQMSEYEQ